MLNPVRYAMVIETTRCVGCGACVIACKNENDVPEGRQRDWIEQEVRGSFPHLSMENRSQRCQHCDRPPCVSCCPTGASYVGPGGATLVDTEKCTGCKACIASCPYDARYIKEEEGFLFTVGVIDKCTFCDHRVVNGMLPACVEICPTSCLHFGDKNDLNSEVRQLIDTRRTETQKSHLGTEPQLYWIRSFGNKA